MFNRFLSRLSLTAKLLLLLCAFALPLILLASYTVSLIEDDLTTVANELKGVEQIHQKYSELGSFKTNQDYQQFEGALWTIGQQSTLVLDPDADSYYLQRVVDEDAPQLINNLWKLSSETDSTKMKQYAFVVQYHLLPQIFESLKNAKDADSSTNGTSETLQQLFIDTSRLQKELADQIAEATSTLTIDKPKIDGVRDHVQGFAGRALVELKVLLEMRQEKLHHHFMRALIVVALAMVILPLLSWGIVKNIHRRLMNVMDIMSKAGTNGDLRAVYTDDGKDEIHELSMCFNEMIKNVRGVVKNIAESGGLVQLSTVEIAASSKQQQATSSEIAATSAEIEATSKRISQTAEVLSQTMLEVQGVSNETASLASDGHTSLARMRQIMQGINDSCQGIANKLEALNQKAGRIGDVVTTIAKVADQTNLLSLNAAIEAEKAGEFGHGFTVVAREIRRLADQTAVATIDIEQMVKEIQGAVAAGVMGMEKFASDVRLGANEVENTGDQLSLIINQIQTLTPSFQSVSDGMQHQALSAKQITDGLSQLSTAVRQTADSLIQSNVSIDQLHQATVILEKEVQRFQV